MNRSCVLTRFALIRLNKTQRNQIRSQLYKRSLLKRQRVWLWCRWGRAEGGTNWVWHAIFRTRPSTIASRMREHWQLTAYGELDALSSVISTKSWN